MDYCIYKLKFKTPVHFGSGRLSGSLSSVCADTVFSAFCIEALKIYGTAGIERLYNAACNDELLISDAMPYIENTFFIPKPACVVKADKQGDSVLKKKFKNLKYIPVGELNNFLSGSFIPDDISFGYESTRSAVWVKENDDNQPYNIGLYHFDSSSGKTGLYIIVSTQGETGALIDELMESLSYTGIGGKVSSGFGKFEYTYNELDKAFKERLGTDCSRYMSLSLSMPNEEELTSALDGASYEIIKRSGFVASKDYSDTPLKKQDFYCFKSGSCFTKRFKGGIYDVSCQGRHPVYRYAKPFFIGIE